MIKNYRISTFATENDHLIFDGEFNQLGLSNTISDGKIFTFLEDRKFLNELNLNKNITCVVCTYDFVDKLDVSHVKGILVTENPRLFYFSLHNKLANSKEYALKQYKTIIGDNCCISKLAYIDSKNVTIGNNVIIEEFVSIRGHCSIGDNVIIHSGAKIGNSGYEFKKNGEEFYMVEHCGKTVIGNNVVIWPNVTIHKAIYPWDMTSIGANSKINSQVHIDHGAKIGLRCAICAGTTISGRVVLEDYCYVGPGAVISNRIKLGKASRVSLGSVVTKSVRDNETVTGNFAIEHFKFIEKLKY